MRLLKESDVEQVSGAAWWSPSTIYDFLYGGRNESSEGNVSGFGDIERRPVDASVGAVLGAGVLIIAAGITVSLATRFFNRK
ncbi:hypothetical protein NG99_04895 [Erwinia typographi]|uniref:Uncharacterized protein n=1 Tax=Erwinia typographi TaxID=371042 RepID=A0A0A3ZBL9_9GAMM|nr:hypothetical protein [Erwinia typographi]KGT94986.1 hypothetical protein NG99_04895 [Erwinia typographi]